MVVLMTRIELEHVSEIAELQKPMSALRMRNLGSSVWRPQVRVRVRVRVGGRVRVGVRVRVRVRVRVTLTLRS